ncbi:2-succinyl-5-enolpyruvyl-6-hydroxy-3-cyclohexene-1-carboxylic-acid synthase [Actinomarinicola tropica]|uniref:2-succinyl-5-enolpyruvyl-6-hydroxy-3-cyclohexene-1-carboxylate synthase n=1 Tax=Actinomarinicola tropica TaxID=2789776 RepID=A0A5Q2RKS5_9ACTN|nr:2-succinyl-5-enolpyruvyl-6-hydroxy-3-cyclohexene-1-carboxylic-acid synthase [Actinomarinicola tropica]QGG95522.1 2-succinyl-5-enolpyruvyl-6-hydroxy-3-cyclohexene-1-carboxylic-acid synthase [Actinomarinicola tropica]
MSDVPETTAATFCATLVDEWHRCGITDVVVAPGSRSTPLALAVAADDRLRVHVHHDERSAGFLALGLALVSGRPAPVITTSGTAAVELHPAVVEAHHARVPMICVTADRPPELRHVGAPQTVDQNRLYGHAVRWFVDPGVPDEASRPAWRSLAARAVAEATGVPAGPVQVNLPFRDPLVGRPGPLPAARDGAASWHRSLRPDTPLGEAALAEIAGRLVGRRGVIVAGATGGGRGADAPAVHDLARALGWPVLADPRSGCRTPDGTTVAHGDLLLRHAPFAEAHRPEVVVQVGEPAASKVQGQWLAGSGADLVVVGRDGAWFDPDRLAAVSIVADPTLVCTDLAERVRAERHEVDDAWLESWAAADAAAEAAVTATLAGHEPATEPGTARALVGALPDGSQLVVASSMPIRDVEWFAPARAGLAVLANRGANGIDGVVSTAVGAALGAGTAPTALLIGDVALLHDTNGLLGLGGRPLGGPLLLVVVDNDGGGIFSFLPQARQLPTDRFEQLFGTPHGVDIAALAALHDLPVTVVERDADLAPALSAGLTGTGAHVVVVRTRRDTNVAVHDELNAAVASALRQDAAG